LPKIKFTLWKRLKSFLSRTNYSLLYRGSFIAGYLFVCTLVLLPQIDYQTWYPEIAGKFDYELGIDFSQHTQVIIETEGKQYLPTIMSILNNRFKELGIRQNITQLEDNNIILHIPSTLSERIIDLTLAKGDISITKRSEESLGEYSIETLYDPSNYEDADIQVSKIVDAQIITQEEGYTSIEISTESRTEQNKWNALAQQIEASSLGVFVDGNLYLSQIVPTSDGNPKPKLIIFSEEIETRLIASQLRNPTLSGITNYQIEISNPIYKLDFRIALLISILLSVISGLVYKYYVQKYSNRSVSNIILIILGLLTVSKSLPITWGMIEIIILSLIILTYLLVEKDKIPTISILLIMLSISIDQMYGFQLYGTGKIMLFTGIYSIITYSLLFFIGLYED